MRSLKKYIDILEEQMPQMSDTTNEIYHRAIMYLDLNMITSIDSNKTLKQMNHLFNIIDKIPNIDETAKSNIKQYNRKCFEIIETQIKTDQKRKFIPSDFYRQMPSVLFELNNKDRNLGLALQQIVKEIEKNDGIKNHDKLIFNLNKYHEEMMQAFAMAKNIKPHIKEQHKEIMGIIYNSRNHYNARYDMQNLNPKELEISYINIKHTKTTKKTKKPYDKYKLADKHVDLHEDTSRYDNEPLFNTKCKHFCETCEGSTYKASLAVQSCEVNMDMTFCNSRCAYAEY